MITISDTLFLILLFGSILYISWAWLWLFRPFKCTCGKLIWTRHTMKKHLAQPHKWDR
jgi:hypothetical protein